MHPNPQFREDDPSFYQRLVDRVGFGMVFCDTPDGPRVAHTPLLWTEEGGIRFHLARGNALTSHLADRTALIVINGPDAYISARWYEDPNQVPTWNYVAAEIEGTVCELARDQLVALLEALSLREEAGIADGTPWTMDKLSPRHRDGLLKAIVGFELTASHRRATVKLSQNKSGNVRKPVIEGLERQGETEIAQLMRELPA